MGTISNKLTYLNETKQKLKDDLNKFGAELTENDTFRSYSNVLNDIYDKLPRVTGNGSSFTLEDTQNGYLDDFKMYGNTEQTTYTGKNLFDKNDNNIILNFRIGQDGGNYGAYDYYISPFIKVNPNTQYTKNSPTADSYHRFAFYTSDNVSSIIGVSENNTYTTPSNCEYIRFCGLQTELDTTMLVQGSTTGDYEPYVGGTPSPNPDYPQDVRVVTGEQDIEVSGKNLAKSKTVYNTTNNYAKVLYVDFDIKPNTTYTFSFNGTSGNTVYFNENLFTTADYVTISNNRVESTVTTKSTIVSSQYEDGKGWAILKNAAGNTNANVFDDLQVEYGSTATPYEPYQSQTYPINLGTMELCKIPNTNYQDIIFHAINGDSFYDTLDNATKQTLTYGKWYKHSEIGKVLVDTSNITLRSNYTNIEYAEIIKPNDFIGKGNYADYNVYCSHAISDIKSAVQYAWDSTYRIGKITNKANVNNLWLGFSKGTGLDNIKTALNGAIVYYVLATPTNTEITDTTLISQLNAIETYTGTNTFSVSNSNGVLPTINVERLKELDKLN